MKNCVLFFMLLFSVYSLNAKTCFNTWANPLPTGESIMSSYITEYGDVFLGGTGGLLMSITDEEVKTAYYSYIRDFTDFSFVGESLAYAVSSSGEILKSTDSGANWMQVQFPYEDSFFKILSTEKYPLIVASREKIYVSEDEIEWIVYEFEDDYISDFSIIDEEYLAVASYNGELLKFSIETGEYETLIPEGVRIANVQFLDSQVGYMIAIYHSFPIFCKTTDGGINWDTREIMSINGGKLFVVDENRMFIHDDTQSLYLSEDGGNTWENIFFNEDNNKNIQTLSFNSSGKMVIAGSAGMIFVSENWGQTWTEFSQSFTSQDLNSISFIDESNGWIAGDYSIFKTTTSGGSWEEIELATQYEGWISFIHFINKSTGFLFYDYMLMKTTDGGYYWYEVEVESDYTIDEIAKMKFFNDNYGLLFGDGIYKTTDGGETWNAVYLLPDDWVMIFSDTWYNDNGSYAFGVRATDTEEGAIVYEPLMLATTDAGNTWNPVDNLPPVNYLTNGYFDSPNSGILIGLEVELNEYGQPLEISTLVFKYTDDGEWELAQMIPDFACLYGEFLNRDESVFICIDLENEVNYIGAIHDEGTALALGQPFSNYLRDIKMINANQGYAVGDYGSLIELYCTFTSVQDDITGTRNPLNLSISPNPAKDIVTLSLTNNLSGEVQINLVDINGNTVSSNMHNTGFGEFSTTLNVSHLPSGVYYISIVAGKLTMHDKLVISK